MESENVDVQPTKRARPRGLLGSIRWIFARNKWTLALSVLAVSVTLLMASLGLGVSDITGSPAKVVGIVFFAVRIVAVTLLLMFCLPFTVDVIGKLTSSDVVGKAVENNRYKIYFYYLLMELLLFLA